MCHHNFFSYSSFNPISSTFLRKNIPYVNFGMEAKKKFPSGAKNRWWKISVRWGKFLPSKEVKISCHKLGGKERKEEKIIHVKVEQISCSPNPEGDIACFEWWCSRDDSALCFDEYNDFVYTIISSLVKVSMHKISRQAWRKVSQGLSETNLLRKIETKANCFFSFFFRREFLWSSNYANGFCLWKGSAKVKDFFFPLETSQRQSSLLFRSSVESGQNTLVKSVGSRNNDHGFFAHQSM